VSEKPEWRNETVTLAALTPWERNPKRISEANAERLLAYWDKIGQFQTIAIGPNGEVYDGHQRLSVLKAARGPSYEVDVRRSSRPLTEKEREELVIAAHTGTVGQYDWDALAGWDFDDLGAWGFDADTLAQWNDDAANLRVALEVEGGDGQDMPLVTYVPDAVWPTDNGWGVPLLDKNLQATSLDAPFLGWGSVARTQRMQGTWHFYTGDYRFEALWSDPAPVVNTRCTSVVEPNFSCYNEMPMAVGLWQVYRKRWLARWWQSYGIRVFVDLNVAPKFYDLNWLGVPEGWMAYGTRGYTDRLDWTETEYTMACEHAGTDSVLFVVYGGGQAVEEACKEHGWLWMIETMQKGVTRG